MTTTGTIIVNEVILRVTDIHLRHGHIEITALIDISSQNIKLPHGCEFRLHGEDGSLILTGEFKNHGRDVDEGPFNLGGGHLIVILPVAFEGKTCIGWPT